jgi:2'-5' RNA ligase
MVVGTAITRRLFFAIDLDEPTRAAIANLVERLRERLESDSARQRGPVKWVERENLHMTVRFLGATPEARVQELQAALNRPLSSKPFALGFDRVGTFPERGAPRVVWLGASVGAAEAAHARDELDERLKAVNVPPEPRPFRPHLTLGRFREPGRGSDRRAIREVGVDAFQPMRVGHLTLYESHLSTHGPRYVPVLSIGLGSSSV